LKKQYSFKTGRLPIIGGLLYSTEVSAQYDARWRTDDYSGGSDGGWIIGAVVLAVAFLFGTSGVRSAILQLMGLFGFPLIGGLIGKEIAEIPGAVVGMFLGLYIWSKIWLRMK